MDPRDPPPLAERVLRALLADDRATPALGMQVLHVGAGSATVTMPVREDMLNGHRTCHGGFVFALADSAFAFACNAANQRAVAAGCQIDFLLPARAGDLLRATATERHAGKRLGLYDVLVSNQHAQTVALFRGRSCRIPGTVVPEDPID